MKKTVRATVLSTDPAIIYVGNYAAFDESSEFYYLSSLLEGVKVTFLMLIAWTAEYDSPSLKIVEWRKNYLSKYPNNKLIFLTNTYGEKCSLERLGAEAEFCNHNTFVDERIFRPLLDHEKCYDAVYNGQFLDFKRHELAAKIDPIALIGYNFDTEYAQHVQSKMQYATFCNRDVNGNLQWLNSDDVNIIYNKSHVGLCLSKAEGAMHASMEYLLSGIPVVTTHNKGGRDYFFQGDFVIWVDDNPDAIADSVNSLKKMRIDPDYIREETLRKLHKSRTNFFEYLTSLIKEIPEPRDYIQNVWEKNYNDKLIVPKDCIELSSYILKGIS